MKLNPKIYHTALALYCLLIFILSSIPGYDFPKVDFEFSDKIVHAIIYAVLCILFFYSLKNQSKYAKLQKFALGYSVLFTALYGITDELHQYFVTNRSCEFYDWVADLTGAVIMYLILKFVHQRNISTAALLLLLLSAGCTGTDSKTPGQNVNIVLENTESWLDFMPVAGDDDKNRFGFVISLKFSGKSPDTNYTIGDFVINLNNDVLKNKKFKTQIESYTDSGFVMNVHQSYNEKYLDKNKNYPEEVSYSFNVNKNSRVIKTFITPKTKILKTQ